MDFIRGSKIWRSYARQEGEIMKIHKRGKAAGVAFIVLLWGIIPGFSYAAEQINLQTKAVVFLLDASGSMKTNDPNRYAIDGIAQFIYALPSNYEVGFVAYNTSVCAQQTLLKNDERGQIMELADRVQYNGYSNAGAGLERAVELLEQSSAAKKDIVLLSDGEFLMADEELTQESQERYQKGMERAKKAGIRIHIIGLGEEMEDTKNSIFQAAAYTEGGSYYTPQALEIQAAIDSLLGSHLNIKQITAAIVDAEGSMETISMEIPFSHTDRIRILLTSSSAIGNLKTSFQAESASQINGERYSLIQVDRPQSNLLEVSFIGTVGNQVRITLIPEYQVISKADISYQDSEPTEEEMAVYDREATIIYTFYDAGNENIRLWTEEYFQYGKIGLQTEGEQQEGVLQEGKLVSRITVRETVTTKVSFDCSKLPVNVTAITPVEIELEEPPFLPVQKPPYVLYGILAITAISISAVLIYKKKQPQLEVIPENDGRPAPGKSSYVGKIKLYISRAPSGYDIKPLAYDLFRLPSTKVVSLEEILESCGIKEVFEGAESIYISSGQGRSIILTNQSDCCIMMSGEILMKQKSYQLFEEAKVDITFEDEISELTFQYKGLRPSEMQ